MPMRKIKFKFSFTRLLLSLIVIALACFVCFCESTILSWFGQNEYISAKHSEFTVCFFNVGQGDCSLIKYKDISIVIDAGEKKAGSDLCAELKRLNGNEIDYFFLTHADSDHVGGASQIFDNFDVKNLIRPKMLSSAEAEEYGNPNDYAIHDTDPYDSAIMSAYEEKCNISYTTVGQFLSFDNFSLEVLYPLSDADLKSSETNSYSSIIKAEYYETSYLFMADADFEMEEKLMEKYGSELDCDVLKVAHHGSKYASSNEFLELVTPTYAVISVGDYGIKSYGHAGTELKTRITNSGAIICQTSEAGHVVFSGKKLENIFMTFSFPYISVPIVIAVTFFVVAMIWGINIHKFKKNKRN